MYEVFITSLPPDGFHAADVLDLYHGRGAFEGTLADEDWEGDPDRWCSYAAQGQELWQVVWQWVWNLRLALGQLLDETPARAMEWAPALSSANAEVDVPTPNAVEEAYGPLQWAQPRGRARGRFGAEAFTLREDGKLQCPAGVLLWHSETRQETAFTQRLIYVARDEDCLGCSLRASCLSQSASGKRGRRVSARRRWLPSPYTTTTVSLGQEPIRWHDVAGRRLRRLWMAHWRSQAVTIEPLPSAVPPPPRPPRAERAHRRLSWDERLSRNACDLFPLAAVHIAGVPPRVQRALQAHT